MVQDWKRDKPSCFIEFRVYDEQRYQMMAHFFKPLRDHTKNLGQMYVGSGISAPTIATSLDDTQEALVVGTAEQTQARRQFGRPEEWLLALRPPDMQLLNMPDHRTCINTLRDWQGLSRRERRKLIRASENKNELRSLADFVDMLRYWQDVEFELLELEQTASDKAQISYIAFDFPFKGKAALEELLLFFGFLSVLNDSC